MLLTRKFWQATTERAVKTFAQTLSVALGAGALDVLAVGWKQALSLAAGATLLSVLTSLGSTTVADSQSPSLIGEAK